MNGMPLSVAASSVMQVLRDHGYEAYIVGGAVRDYLLGKSPHDYDVSTSASVAQIRACFPHEHIIENNGEKHGTVTVRIEGENIEITEFRHAPHETPSIKVDLRHRDLTINAIAYDGTSIIDPCGGLDALGRRILTMGPNPESVIAEDPLRILRVLRFQAVLGFDVDKPTAAAIKRNATMLRGVAKERILAELRHILIDSNIGTRMEEYPEIFTTLFPDLLPTVGFDQHTPWHAHTLYVHIAHVTQNTVADFISRFAALLHDNGKVDTCMREDKPDGTYVCHFYGHPLVSAYMAKPVLSEYRVPQKEAAQILFLIEQHDRTISPNRKSVRKALARIVAVEPAEPLELLKKLLSSSFNIYPL